MGCRIYATHYHLICLIFRLNSAIWFLMFNHFSCVSFLLFSFSQSMFHVRLFKCDISGRHNQIHTRFCVIFFCGAHLSILPLVGDLFFSRMVLTTLSCWMIGITFSTLYSVSSIFDLWTTHLKFFSRSTHFCNEIVIGWVCVCVCACDVVPSIETDAQSCIANFNIISLYLLEIDGKIRCWRPEMPQMNSNSRKVNGGK